MPSSTRAPAVRAMVGEQQLQNKKKDSTTPIKIPGYNNGNGVDAGDSKGISGGLPDSSEGFGASSSGFDHFDQMGDGGDDADDNVAMRETVATPPRSSSALGFAVERKQGYGRKSSSVYEILGDLPSSKQQFHLLLRVAQQHGVPIHLADVSVARRHPRATHPPTTVSHFNHSATTREILINVVTTSRLSPCRAPPHTHTHTHTNIHTHTHIRARRTLHVLSSAMQKIDSNLKRCTCAQLNVGAQSRRVAWSNRPPQRLLRAPTSSSLQQRSSRSNE
jgi:hypothetical protein